MRYRIEYENGRCCNFAEGHEELLEWLKVLKDETITDIRKVYRSGATDSVMDKYGKYIHKVAKAANYLGVSIDQIVNGTEVKK